MLGVVLVLGRPVMGIASVSFGIANAKHVLAFGWWLHFDGNPMCVWCRSNAWKIGDADCTKGMESSPSQNADVPVVVAPLGGRGGHVCWVSF